MNQETLEDLREQISASLPNEINDIVIAYGEITVLARADQIVEVLTFLKNDSSCKFTQLTDLCGADYPERAKRFDVVYQLLSVTQNQRIRVKIQTDEETPVPSVVDVYPAAGWYERETWDMYGVMFNGNPDLRRILTDYGFQGFPLRKDFPLTGYVELRYSEEEKRVVYEPVQLTQEFRKFDFMSPWEGAKYILPGDEKAESGQEGK
ncbi:NADH-quinone oxidoreductase subunit C [Emcibacter nanhaiensis]|uniref:NADH-quinone oxidoreductase subunit C n=1 Tax=Emcibacter nanhaiensis TaxID=1505037 RepID=A0A501PS38_9PROT|nr:NADH-quinone oxidoreductase subunit C [Emcibacter nanhaiensis]TPD62882.1 NADH-quinone oxidoreductase subunit C [Emcibacter nanhaiensis]